MPRTHAADGSDVNGSIASRRAPHVPISVDRTGLGPVVMLAGIFGAFSYAAGLPLTSSLLLGGIGGPVSLLFHELGHARAAQRLDGIRAASISLMWLGAATRLEGRYASGREQMRVAIAGPQASFLFALSLLLVAVFPLSFELRGSLLLLALFNVLLGVINLVPARPLDGYKLIVGLLWWALGSETKAKRLIGRVGRGLVVFELSSCALLVIEKPQLGLFVVAIAGSLYCQKLLLKHLRS